MRNSTAIRGMRTREQYKVIEFINRNFEPGALEIELVDGETIRGTDRNGRSMIFRWSQNTRTVEALDDFNDTIRRRSCCLFCATSQHYSERFQNR